jgi:uncharacterized protein
MGDNSNLLSSAHLTRRAMLCSGLAASVAAVLPKRLAALPWNISQGRPVPADRKFSSPAIEEVIARVKKQIPDPVLATMFERCFPNTLDTTVFPGTREGHPDTFVITGDIDAMWQRDSSAQVHPYLPYAKQDPMLKRLLQGVVRRQVQNILIDPYANAFMRSPSDPPLSWTVHDRTDMKPSVGERKWEVDSLCYTIRLAHGYWKATGDTSPFDAQWEDAAGAIVRTFREQQRFASKGPYSFQRLTTNPLDTTPLGGYGNPARPVGMIFSMFRPSDDCCTYPLFVPANLFAMNALTQLQELASEVSAHKLANDCEALLGTVRPAVQQYARVRHQSFGEIWAYEVDGYGNHNFMDDANAPSLLSLPYLGCCDVQDPLYQRTRKFVLSEANPYLFEGSAAKGVGSPHTGLGDIWPMAIIMHALTSTDDREIVQCVQWLRDTTAGTDFMHESFDANNPAKFTRAWFAWANTLFGELILQQANSKPDLLRQIS